VLPNVRKELDTLLMQLGSWAESYLKEVTGENDDYLIDDLQKDIMTWMSPYVHRLTAVGHITIPEEAEFWSDVSEKFEEFVNDVREGKRIERVIEEDVDKLVAQFNLHKDLADGGHVGFEFTMEQRVKMGDIARKLIPALQRKLKEVEKDDSKEKS
jgi:hypothetical protein